MDPYGPLAAGDKFDDDKYHVGRRQQLRGQYIIQL